MMLLAVASIAVANQSAYAQMMKNNDMNPMVGGSPMLKSKDIVDNAVNSQDHTTLVAAVKAAGTVDTLLKPENKEMLTKVLTYHVLAGKFDSNAIAKKIKAGKGKAAFKTVSGGSL